MEPPMTVKELSDYLRLDRMTIYKMLKEGSIPASRIGHQWRFFRVDIDEWIRSLRISKRTSVLVADGDGRVKKALESELPDDSFELVSASSDEEVADLASERSFDMVFVELGKDTVEAFRKLRSVNEHVPVVLLAGSSDGKLVDQALEVGAFTLMKKPVSGDNLKGVMRSVGAHKAPAV